MKHLLSILIVLATLGSIKAQERNVVQFSGMIYNIDSNVVVPYVSVTNKSDNNKVVSANHQGYFSFVAHEGDTIVFSAIGYSREALVIPRGIRDKRYTVMVKLKSQIVNLPTVNILPWTSVDDFTRDFMALKIADDDLEIAKKNISRSSVFAMSKTLERDSRELQNMSFHNNHINLSNRNINQRGANPLLNPLAWSAFIQQIIQGDKSRAND